MRIRLCWKEVHMAKERGEGEQESVIDYIAVDEKLRRDVSDWV